MVFPNTKYQVIIWKLSRNDGDCWFGSQVLLSTLGGVSNKLVLLEANYFLGQNGMAMGVGWVLGKDNFKEWIKADFRE